MKVIPATPRHADDIVQLIMTAMTDECCQNLAGEHHTLDDFRCVMHRLVLMDDSQYSWRNAFVAVDDEAAADINEAPVAGVIVGYDGARLHALRSRFIEAAKSDFDMDYSQMNDETQAGEYYIDSLAVYSHYRRRGIASMLLQHLVEHAAKQSLPAALLVDKGNPRAERLYMSLGFKYVGDNTWGGHEMKHLVHG